jgi:hypothetical protein
MTHGPSRYFDDLDNDGKSGRRPAVSGRCAGQSECRERIGGAVLVTYALLAVICTTVGLIAGCKIGHAQAKAGTTAPIEATP